MTIYINDQTHQITDNLTVMEVVTDLLQLAPSGMAIALNDKVIPRTQWAHTPIQSEDKILLIKACSGG